MGRDLSQKAESPCLVSAFLVLTRELEGTVSEPSGVIHLSSGQIRLAQPGDQE